MRREFWEFLDKIHRKIAQRRGLQATGNIGGAFVQTPVRHEVACESCGTRQDVMIPPSIRLDESMILNKERIRQSG